MKKYCLNCGNDVFRTATSFSQANMDFVDGKFIFKPLNETIKEDYACQCTQCGNRYNLNDENIINQFKSQGVKCTKCGKQFTEEELDENGVCLICRLKEQDPEFANLENADVFTIFRALAKVKMNNLELNNKLSSELEKAEKVEQKIEEQISNKEEKPKKRGRKKAKEDDVVYVDDDQSNSEQNNEIEISEDVAPEFTDEVVEISEEMKADE